MRSETSRICHVLQCMPQPVRCAVCTPSLPYYRYCRVAQEARQTSSDAVHGRVQWLYPPISGVHDNGRVVRGHPLTSPLIMYGCYHFGLKITFACWHDYAYFPLLDFLGSGVEAGIRMRITGITIMTGGWYMLQGCYGCGVTVDTHFRIGITGMVRPLLLEHVALGYNEATVLLDQT